MGGYFGSRPLLDLLGQRYLLNPHPATLWTGKVAASGYPSLLLRSMQSSKLGITNFKLWQTGSLDSFGRVPWNINIDYDAALDPKVPPSAQPD
jgi:hypothetical protein